MRSKSILVIPDYHAHPDHDNKRATALGRLILDQQPDTVLMMGDWADMPSLSSYDKGKKCVDKDTEFLTLSGWKKISEYKPGDFVAVFDGSSRKIRYEQPKSYVQVEASWFYQIQTSRTEQRVTDSHRLVFVDTNDRITEQLASEFVANHERLVGGHRGRFITTFDYDGPGLGIPEPLLRLLVAFKADGTQCGKVDRRNKSSKSVHKFHFKRPDKIERIEKLLKDTGLEYTRRDSKQEGFVDFWTHIYGATKRYDWNYSDLSKKDAEIIIDEMLYWDGSKTSNRFSSVNKQDADFIQYCFALVGQRARVAEGDNSSGFNSNGRIFRVHGSDQNLPGVGAGSSPKADITKVASEDGKAYCFSTSTGMWLSRRNGHITVTGNSFEGRRYVRDVQASIEAQECLWDAVDRWNEKQSKNRKAQYRPTRIMLRGNHCEGRIERVTNLHPELHGTISVGDLQYERFWDHIIPFKSRAVVEGFAVSHYFTSGTSSEAVSGLHQAHNLLVKNGMSSIVGHSHVLDIKIGTRADGNKTLAISAGCYTHPDHIEGWNADSQYKWWNGVVWLGEVHDGWAEMIAPTSQKLIMENYGD